MRVLAVTPIHPDGDELERRRCRRLAPPGGPASVVSTRPVRR